MGIEPDWEMLQRSVPNHQVKQRITWQMVEAVADVHCLLALFVSPFNSHTWS
jgi:hypothetical protein